MAPVLASEFPTDRHGLIHRSAVVAAGLSDRDLAAAVSRGDVERITRGVFAPAATRTPAELHRLNAIAVSVAGVAHPLSHQSAAAVHRLDLLKPNYRRVHTTICASSGGRRQTTRHEHAAMLSDDDVTIVNGIPVTSLERTAVDVACTTTMRFAGALAVFDAALRRGASRDRMKAMLTGSRRGVGIARRALDFADPRSENPGESWGRAQIIEGRLPIPRLQHEFRDDNGEVFARADYDWEGKVVAEFDGKVKYGRGLTDGELAGEDVWKEKQRENALRRRGIRVIRWTWDDLENRRVAAIVREELTLSGLLVA